jgi:predicted dehydrogenase
MVAEDVHFRSPVREAFLAVERGDIGEPLYLLVRGGGVLRPEGWKADKDRAGGGVLMDLGVHYVRAMRLLLGEPDRVFASRAMQVNGKMSGEDSVQLVFSSHFGWQVHMLLSWVSPRGDLPDMIVAGEKGTIHLWSAAPFYDLYPAYPLTLTRLLSYVRPAWLGEAGPAAAPARSPEDRARGRLSRRGSRVPRRGRGRARAHQHARGRPP